MSTDQTPQPLYADDYQASAEVRYQNSQRRGGPEECFFCGRPLTESATRKGWWVHLSTAGVLLPMAGSEALPKADDQGWFPVGSECAKAIPLTHRAKSAAVSA